MPRLPDRTVLPLPLLLPAEPVGRNVERLVPALLESAFPERMPVPTFVDRTPEPFPDPVDRMPLLPAKVLNGLLLLELLRTEPVLAERTPLPPDRKLLPPPEREPPPLERAAPPPLPLPLRDPLLPLPPPLPPPRAEMNEAKAMTMPTTPMAPINRRILDFMAELPESNSRAQDMTPVWVLRR
jgi:hypothetical protein